MSFRGGWLCGSKERVSLRSDMNLTSLEEKAASRNYRETQALLDWYYVG
jgi:hypothetical protein